MLRWREALQEALFTGTVASAASAAVLAWAGRRETPSAAAPVNGPSQWLWGTKEAQRADHADARHTLVGYLVHHGAVTLWAIAHALAYGDRPKMREPLPALAAAGGTAVAAAVVDLRLTPERFTPGFQHRLSTPSLAATYVAFGVGLAVASWLAGRQRR